MSATPRNQISESLTCKPPETLEKSSGVPRPHRPLGEGNTVAQKPGAGRAMSTRLVQAPKLTNEEMEAQRQEMTYPGKQVLETEPATGVWHCPSKHCLGILHKIKTQSTISAKASSIPCSGISSKIRIQVSSAALNTRSQMPLAVTLRTEAGSSLKENRARTWCSQAACSLGQVLPPPFTSHDTADMGAPPPPGVLWGVRLQAQGLSPFEHYCYSLGLRKTASELGLFIWVSQDFLEKDFGKSHHF